MRMAIQWFRLYFHQQQTQHREGLFVEPTLVMKLNFVPVKALCATLHVPAPLPVQLCTGPTANPILPFNTLFLLNTQRHNDLCPTSSSICSSNIVKLKTPTRPAWLSGMTRPSSGIWAIMLRRSIWERWVKPPHRQSSYISFIEPSIKPLKTPYALGQLLIEGLR